MSIELDNHITGAAYQLYKYTHLLRSTDLGRGKMRPCVDRIFDDTRLILAECSVYSLSLAEAAESNDAFLHYQHFVRQAVNVVNVNIWLITENHEQYPFEDTQLQYISMLEKHFQEMTRHLDNWADTNFGRTIFKLREERWILRGSVDGRSAG